MVSLDAAVAISNIVSATVSAISLVSSVVAFALRRRQTSGAAITQTEAPKSTDHIVISKRFLKNSVYLFSFSLLALLVGSAFAGRVPGVSSVESTQAPTTQQPVRLSVVGLAANPPSESAFFQIKAIVNGKVFTIPGNGEWMAAQSTIRAQSVILPPLTRYAIQFQVRKRDAYFANATPATLDGDATVRYSGGTTSGTYLLKGFDTTSPTGGGAISATVAYRLAPAR